jgi:hypothetical protein
VSLAPSLLFENSLAASRKIATTFYTNTPMSNSNASVLLKTPKADTTMLDYIFYRPKTATIVNTN